MRFFIKKVEFFFTLAVKQFVSTEVFLDTISAAEVCASTLGILAILDNENCIVSI
jgi:hypothetical protein